MSVGASRCTISKSKPASFPAIPHPASIENARVPLTWVLGTLFIHKLGRPVSQTISLAEKSSNRVEARKVARPICPPVKSSTLSKMNDVFVS